MGNNQSVFGLRTGDVTCHGAKNGYAILCVSPMQDTENIEVEIVYVTWKKGNTVIREEDVFESNGSDAIYNLVPGDDYVTCIRIVILTQEGPPETETFEYPFTIGEPLPLKVCVEVTDPTWKCGGKASATVKNAMHEVTITWSKICHGKCKVIKAASECSKINDLSPGIYIVEVMDMINGCKAHKVFEVQDSC